jgi:hypothetical protein
MRIEDSFGVPYDVYESIAENYEDYKRREPGEQGKDEEVAGCAQK